MCKKKRTNSKVFTRCLTQHERMCDHIVEHQQERRRVDRLRREEPVKVNHLQICANKCRFFVVETYAEEHDKLYDG